MQALFATIEIDGTLSEAWRRLDRAASTTSALRRAAPGRPVAVGSVLRRHEPSLLSFRTGDPLVRSGTLVSIQLHPAGPHRTVVSIDAVAREVVPGSGPLVRRRLRRLTERLLEDLRSARRPPATVGGPR